jgi:flagellar biosynthesis anti-sigma factor FlgM
MKINPISNPNILKSYQSTKATAERTQLMGGKDEVSFSPEALEFSKALAAAREVLETRTPAEASHIANITNTVREGTYRIDSEAVAEKILESAQWRK